MTGTWSTPGEGGAGKAGARQLRAFLDSVKGYGIFLLDPGGRVLTWSAGTAALKGWSEQEILGQHFSCFYTPEDRAAGRPELLLDEAARTGRVEDEGWRVRKDGTRFWADVVISAMREPDGTLSGFVKVTRDLTDRRRAELALAARAAQQAAVADLGLEALRDPDLQPVLDRAVALVAATLGVDVVEVLELSPAGDALVLRAGVGLRAEQVGAAVAPPRWPPELGARRALEALARDPRLGGALLGPEGVVSGATVVVHAVAGEEPYGVLGAYARSPHELGPDDVNFLNAAANVIASAIARSRMEAQLRAAEACAHEERLRNAQALEAVRERDEFISIAAHELRTPLTVLQLKLQGLEQAVLDGGGVRDEGQRRRIDAAVRHAARLRMLVDRLLEVSRIAAGRLELHLGDVDLRELVAGLVEGFRDEASRAGCELRLAAPASVRGTFDGARLEQVILNLLANAAKYGAGKPVEVAVEDAGDVARITVRDRGIGISPEAQRRIFDRFERAVPVRHYGGLGLGLYIARHVVDAHGGRISVASDAGEGAAFTVELPRPAPRGA